MINSIKKYLGWRNWAVLYYNSIFENLFLFFYISLSVNDQSESFLIHILFFLLFSVFSTTYGYLINDIADRELDHIHGKANTFQNDSPLKSSLVVLVIFCISFLLTIPFWPSRYFLILWGIWLFLATFYSLPPFRFKERGKFGLFLVVLAQRVIPVLLVFTAFSFLRLADVIILLNLILARGFSSDINHQWQDYTNDLRTNTKTSAVEIGIKRFEKIFKIVLEYEKLAMILALYLISRVLQDHLLFGLPYFSFPLILYLILCLIALARILKSGNYSIEFINPYSAEKKDIFQMIHLLFPNILLSVYLLLYIILINPFYIVFIFIIILIYRLYSFQIIKNSFLGRAFTKLIK